MLTGNTLVFESRAAFTKTQDIILMLGQRHRRWTYIKTTLVQGLVFVVTPRIC